MNIAAIILLLSLSTGCFINEEKPVVSKPYPPRIEVRFLENGSPRYISGEYFYEAKDKYIKLTSAHGDETIVISGEYILVAKKAGR